jgi:KilA-N domain
MSNLTPDVLVYHKFNDIEVAQMRNGYINASALAGGNAKVIQYSAEFAALVWHLSNEMGVDTNNLMFVCNGDFYLHPRLALSFAAWMSDEHYLFVSGWVFTWMQQPVSNFKIRRNPEDVYTHLRKCYRIGDN